MGQMLSFFKKLDVEQMQHHLANVTSAIGSVQQVFQQFQGKRTQQEESTSKIIHFSFRRIRRKADESRNYGVYKG